MDCIGPNTWGYWIVITPTQFPLVLLGLEGGRALCAAVMLKWLLKRKSEIIAFYGLKCSVRTVGTHFREKKIILGPPGGARGGQRGV